MSQLTLYHLFPSRSCRVLWLIKELGLDVKLIEKNFLADKSACLKDPEFLAITPTGKIPALQDGDAVVTESTAITLYILEKYGEGRLQPSMSDSAGRAKLLRYTVQSETEIVANLADVFWHGSQLPEEDRRPQVAEIGKKRGLEALEVFEKELEGKQFLINDEFSAADIGMGYAAFFSGMLGLLDETKHCNIIAYQNRLKERACYQEVFHPSSE
mmetsp:Transcript_7998/g.23605  ORF Transcript_7998/g.23605 Transcript_7998/m.23605 type:complete len:214 (-) Transcript_7998:2982-3623(-)